jgi:hypothetical protein
MDRVPDLRKPIKAQIAREFRTFRRFSSLTSASQMFIVVSRYQQLAKVVRLVERLIIRSGGGPGIFLEIWLEAEEEGAMR